MRKEKIQYKDMNVIYHPTDGFTLSYLTDDNRYFKRRYMYHKLHVAKSMFRKYIYDKLQEDDFFN